MSVWNVPRQRQRGSQPPPPPSGSEEAIPRPPSPPRDSDYGARLREVEQLVSSPEWQAPGDGEGLRPHVPRERVEELGGARLFPSDPRAAFVLLNEARCRAIQGVFGVRRDQVNLMTLIAAMTLAEAVHSQTRRLRRGLRGPTRADVILADGLLNALGQQIAGPSSREIPFFAALVGTAAFGTVAARVLRRSAHDMKAMSHGIKLSFSYLFHQTGAVPRSTRSG